jgi:cell filamentation protein
MKSHIGLCKRTFANPYDLAGVYRSADMSKGGSLFCLAQHLSAQIKRLFHNLEQERFLKQAKSTTKEHFAERLAYYQCELITLHPFYELNGRTTQQFFDLIAIASG